MQTTLDPEQDKTITHTIHKVLMWFDQPYIHLWIRDNISTIQ